MNPTWITIAVCMWLVLGCSSTPCDRSDRRTTTDIARVRPHASRTKDTAADAAQLEAADSVIDDSGDRIYVEVNDHLACPIALPIADSRQPTDAEDAVIAWCLGKALRLALHDEYTQVRVNRAGFHIIRHSQDAESKSLIKSTVAQHLGSHGQWDIVVVDGGCGTCATVILTVADVATRFVDNFKIRGLDMWAAIVNTVTAEGFEIDPKTLEAPPNAHRFFVSTSWKGVQPMTGAFVGFRVFERLEIELAETPAALTTWDDEPQAFMKGILHMPVLTIQFAVCLRPKSSNRCQYVKGERETLELSFLGVKTMEPQQAYSELLAKIMSVVSQPQP